MSWQYNRATGEWWDDEDIYNQAAVDHFFSPQDPTPEETQEALDYHQPLATWETETTDLPMPDLVGGLREASRVNWPGASRPDDTQPFTVGADGIDIVSYGDQILTPTVRAVAEAAESYGAPSGPHGIDVARYQGAPDWTKVAAAGVRFAYVKASEGSVGSYSTTTAQFTGASRAGLKVGLYHYARPNLSPEANADAFAAQISKLGPGQLPPCLDLEEPGANLGQWSRQFFTRLRARTGITRMMLYSGAAFFKDNIGESWMDSNIILWIAHYGVPPGKPRYLTPRVAIHQYSSTGRLPGIVGNVDLNHLIWPLEDITGGTASSPEDTEMNEADRKMLAEVHATLTRPMKAWPGGSTGDPAVEAYTPLQYMLRDNVETLQTRYAMAALTRQVAELTSLVAALLKALQTPPEARKRDWDPVSNTAADYRDQQQGPPSPEYLAALERQRGTFVQEPDIRSGETTTYVDPYGGLGTGYPQQ